MKRGSFLKRLFGGIAAIVVTPSVLEATKEEELYKTDWVTGEDATNLWIDANNNDTIECVRRDGEDTIYVNGIKDISGECNHLVQHDVNLMGTIE